MSSDLLVCLQHILSPDKNIRVQAEQQLAKYQTQPGYAAELCRIALDPNCSESFRQTAAGMLRHAVKHGWDAEDPETKHPISAAEKAHIRSVLLPALADPLPLIRTCVANVISRIAVEDWPENWPELLPALVTMLHAPNEHIVHGAIHTLSMLVSDSISDEVLPLIIRQIFPEALAIFRSNTFSEQIRVKAAQIFESVVSFISTIESDEPKKLLTPIAPQWIETFTQTLISIPPSPDRRDYGIPCTILQTFTAFLVFLPSVLRDHITKILAPVWNIFTAGLPLYESVMVQGKVDGGAGSVGEGEMGIDILAKGVLEFMEDLISNKKSMKKMIEPHMENIAYYAIGYMQLTNEQAEMYETDPNQYIADDEDDTLNYNPRVAATYVLQSMAENHGSKGIKAIYAAINKRMAESQQYLTQPFVWAMREATFLAIGSVAEEYAENQDKAPNGILPPASLLKDLLLPILMEQIPDGPNRTRLWYLKGRALWCAAQFAYHVENDVAFPFFHACCLLLEPANSASIPVPVKMVAVKAVARFCQSLPVEQLSLYIPTIMQVLCNIIQTASSDSLVLLMNAMLMIARVVPDVTAEYAGTLGPYVQHVWAHHAADPQITEDAKDILFELFKLPCGFIALHPSLSQTLHNALYHPDKLGDMVDASLDILRMIASSTYDTADQRTPQAQTLIQSLIQDLLPALFTLLLNKDTEEQILRTGADCISVLIRYPQCITPDHLQSALKVAHRLLTHESEFVQRRSGELITQLISVWGTQLAPMLPEILMTVLGKLETSKLPETKQGLLMVFIRLINTQDTKLLFDFLASVKVDNTDGLTYLMGFWTKWHENIDGSLNVKVSIAGLGKVFRTQDARLDAITVPGELIVNVHAPRTTRSKKVQQDTWSAVSLRLKILYIFAKEYQEIKVKSEESDDDDEDGDVVDGEAEEEEDHRGKDLAQLMDEMDEMEDGDDDPLDKLDPLYPIPLGRLIEDWMKTTAQETQQHFVAYAQQLPANLQHVTQAILQGQVK